MRGVSKIPSLVLLATLVCDATSLYEFLNMEVLVATSTRASKRIK